jgi:cytochrome c553
VTLNRRILLPLAAFVAAFLVAAPFALRGLMRHWEQNTLLEGRRLAVEAGCLACHAPYRGVELPNPGSRWGSVPRFEAGNAMMYAESLQEIEEYIRFGAPRAVLDDPAAVERRAAQQIRMPAYEGRFSDTEISALTMWAAVVEGVEVAGGEAAAAGRDLARKHGCISCHGLEGAGGRLNPQSIAGFIPGFLGKNFTDLVKTRAEFDEWVRTGQLERLQGKFLARRALGRQAIAMPAYEETLSQEDLDHLWAWIEAVRAAY